MTARLPTPAPCGHLTHLLRGATRYGWDSETDHWDVCDATLARTERAAKPAIRRVANSFLTVAEVAAMMRVSKMTVYRLLHAGELDAVRVGRSFRVREHSVSDFLGVVVGDES